MSHRKYFTLVEFLRILSNREKRNSSINTFLVPGMSRAESKTNKKLHNRVRKKREISGTFSALNDNKKA